MLYKWKNGSRLKKHALLGKVCTIEKIGQTLKNTPQLKNYDTLAKMPNTWKNTITRKTSQTWKSTPQFTVACKGHLDVFHQHTKNIALVT